MSKTLDGVAYSWNAPVCVACWNAQNPDRPANPVPGEDAYVAGAVRRCAYCGGGTTSGILRREDPATVPFPLREVDDEAYAAVRAAGMAVALDPALALELGLVR